MEMTMPDPAQNSAIDTAPTPETQRDVDAFFDAKAEFWDELYRAQTVFARIHQERLAAVLAHVDQLALPSGTRVLDVGCGAGLAAVAAAQRGYEVDAVDSVEAMVGLARQRADQAGVGTRVRTGVADINRLPFPDGAFSLVLCIGVIPWVPSPPDALREVARVLSAGGHVVLTGDNRWRLVHVLDPQGSPLLEPLRRVKRFLKPSPPQPVQKDWVHNHLHSRREFAALLAAAGLQVVQCGELGFGPFTFFSREVFSESAGIRLQRMFQRAAERGFPLVRSTGSQFIVLAVKPGPR
jgi:ubiquinone/menaquinone biosynthesis C-methylase UbiE